MEAFPNFILMTFGVDSVFDRLLMDFGMVAAINTFLMITFDVDAVSNLLLMGFCAYVVSNSFWMTFWCAGFPLKRS